MAASTRSDTWFPSAARTGFWVTTMVGIFVVAIAWFWYGFMQFESQTEQGKALAAGTTMAGFAEFFGGVPLVFAHLLMLTVLLVFGCKEYGEQGIVFSIIAVVVASGLGILFAQVVWQGQLFELGIDNDTFVP